MKACQNSTRIYHQYQSMDRLDLSIDKTKIKPNKIFPSQYLIKTIFNYPQHASNVIIFSNPHNIKQRNQILQIQSKIPIKELYDQNKQKKKQKELLQFNQQFLVQCGNNQYNVMSKLQNCIGISKIDIFNIGKNIIKFTELYTSKQVEKFTNTLSQSGKLIIRGDFQSGNLNKYIELDKNQYGLVLNNDTNTQGYTQWFQLYIQYTPQQNQQQKHKMLKFVILNIRKPIRYMPQMKLLTRSYKQQTRDYQEWTRNLSFTFFQTNLQGNDQRKYYAISFCISANIAKNGIFVALTHTYPFSRLTFLSEQMNNIQSQFRTFQIGKSTLSNPILLFKNQNINPIKKRNIFILARQHASQTSSSFICQFIIKRLSLFNCYDQLVKQLNWHIIPIANPDGVIHGNSRTTSRGYDMNRCWAQYLLQCSSQAQAINKYLQKLQLKADDIFIDLHSHSRELGLFTFTNTQNGFVRYFNEKMSQICKYFDIQKCKSGSSNQKRNTFRVQMFNRLKMRNIITLQTSYYGYICKQTNQLKSYSNYDYQQIAVSLLKCLENYIKNQSNYPLKQNFDLWLRKMQKNQQKEQNKKNQYQSESESDTDPQIDYLDESDRLQLQYNFKQKSNNKNSQKNRSLFYIPNSNHLKNRSSPKAKSNILSTKNKKETNQSNIVNLFKASNSQSSQLKPRSQRPNRIFSAYGKKTIDCQNSKNEKKYFNSVNNQIQIQTKNLKTQNYSERVSFKNLFACAQLRNSQNLTLKPVKKQQQIFAQENYIQQSKSIVTKFELQFKGKQIQIKQPKLKSVIFPTQFLSAENQNAKQIKAIQLSFQKRNPCKALKNYYFQKKIKLNKSEKQDKLDNKQVINQKIAKLCQYVKKIQKRTIFS